MIVYFYYLNCNNKIITLIKNTKIGQLCSHQVFYSIIFLEFTQLFSFIYFLINIKRIFKNIHFNVLKKTYELTHKYILKRLVLI